MSPSHAPILDDESDAALGRVKKYSGGEDDKTSIMVGGGQRFPFPSPPHCFRSGGLETSVFYKGLLPQKPLLYRLIRQISGYVTLYFTLLLTIHSLKAIKISFWNDSDQIKYVILQQILKKLNDNFFGFRLSDHSGCFPFDGVLSVILLTMWTTERMEPLVKQKKKEARLPTALFHFSKSRKNNFNFPLLLLSFSRGVG